MIHVMTEEEIHDYRTKLTLDRFERLNALVKVLYEQPNCLCGGPLHILIDDGNVRDCDLVFCYQNLHHAQMYGTHRSPESGRSDTSDLSGDLA